MAAPSSSRPPDFPYWPFSCLSLYSQVACDFGRCAQAMTASTDAMETARAEGDLGVRLYADLMQGYVDLALTPWIAMASVMVERAGDAAPAAEVRPRRSRASRRGPAH